MNLLMFRVLEINSIKLSKLINLFAIVIMASVLPAKLAFSRDVEPTFAYCATTGVPSFTCPILFASPGEVFSIYQKWLANTPGTFMWVTNLHPDPGSGTQNGFPTYYAADYFRLDNNASEGTSDVIWVVPLCPKSKYTIREHSHGNPSNVVKITCYGYDQVAPDPGCEKCGRHVGNPIYPSTGTKFQKEVDYSGAGSNELEFSRTYRSDQKGWTHTYQAYGVDMTNMESTTYVPCYYDLQQNSNWPRCFRYATTGLKNDFVVRRSGSRLIEFGTANDLSAPADISDTVTRIVTDGVLIGFRVYNSSDESTEIFDTTGRLQATTSRNGRKKLFSYSDASTPLATASTAGLLISVADQFGHALHFTYDSSNRMATMTDSSGGVAQYAYDESTSFVIDGRFAPGNLTSVTYPDGKRRTYWYNEQDKTSGADLPFALTGISDETGARFATFSYDSSGRAISTEHAGGVEKFSVTFPNLWSSSVVTDPLGTSRTYTFQTILGSSKNTGVIQPAPGSVGTISSSMSYDAQGNLSRSTDFSGNVTTFAYDLGRNLETRRVEAFGTSQARTTTTEWHPNFRLPTKIAASQSLTTVTYDAFGNVSKRTVQATSDLNGALGTSASVVGAVRVVTFTYNTAGQVLTESGPRTDVANNSTYVYDAQGNLATAVDAAGHLTTFQNYDANGRAGRIVAANGITTDLTYWPRGWLKQRTVTAGGANETTSYDYDGAGQLKTVTFPDQSTVRYDYDDAHRLTSVIDSVGNKVKYTYDLASNRVLDQVVDPSNVLTGKITRVYDALNLLKQQTGGTQ